MKHIKTFENFNTPVNEELWGLGKRKERKFREALDKFINAYSQRMETPTEQDIDEVMELAKKDDYEGKPGLKEVDGKMKLSYRNSKDIKWKSGGHIFGSGE